MNPTGHNAMNGYRANSLASSSSQNYNDFVPHNSSQAHYNNNNVQHQRQPQHPQQSMQRNHPNQWSQHAMQMNGQMNGSQMNNSQINPTQMNNTPTPPLPHNHQNQNQPPFNQAAWGNQMLPPQGFPAGMAPMAFNMPFLHQQILQEAYAMSSPVEAGDEPTLLTKLLGSRRKGESYKDALNGLHGKNGHSASLWKDYYLDHKERIDAWIAMCLQKEKEDQAASANGNPTRSASSDFDRVIKLPTAKKPSPSTFKHEPSPRAQSTSRQSVSAPAVKKLSQKKPSKSATPIPIENPGSGRSTINSITAPAPIYGDRFPAPNAEIKIPEPPSRSPSPPTDIIPQGRGNKYTKEDRDFFIKFIGWRLKLNPDLTRQELYNLLAEKAPHHSAQSWASHWSNNHDLPDKILAAARGDDHDEDEESSSDEEQVVVRRSRPKYRDPTTSEESESESEVADNNEDEGEEEDDDDPKPLGVYTEQEMGRSGGPFTDADLYFTAKHIASFEKDWKTALAKDRWDPHYAKFPHRSAKAWGEYYRRNESSILKMAKRIQQQDRTPSKSAAMPAQCGRPTRTPPKAKRKFEFDESDVTLVKKGRNSS